MEIKFPPIAIIGNVQDEMLENERNICDLDENVLFNFKECEFIEPITLLYIIAFLVYRAKNKKEFKISLPKIKKVRDFLRAWNFPEAFVSATHLPFYSSIIEDDKKYFGENVKVEDMKYAGRIIDSGYDRLLSDRFFAIRSFTLSQQSRGRKVTDESNRWEDMLIKSVLSKYIDGPSSYIASRLVFEAMTNAIRHPGADVIQTTSILQQKKIQDMGGYFSLVFWDNGKSMIDTLKTAINEDKPIKSKIQTDLYQDIEVINVEKNGIKTISTINTSLIPNKNTSDSLLLLSTTFPGITRDIKGEGHQVHKDLADTDPKLNTPGMGLYILLNTAINVFKGSISFRTKNYFMNIKLNSSTNRYKAKVIEFTEEKSYYPGNMVTIRLPIRK